MAADIELLKKLRNETQVSLADCRKALEETNNDYAKAKEWLAKNPQPTMRDILNFHLFTGDGDKHNDLRMNRNGEMLTLSVTGMEINNEKGIMQYHDLLKNELYKQELHFTSLYAIQ